MSGATDDRWQHSPTHAFVQSLHMKCLILAKCVCVCRYIVLCIHQQQLPNVQRHTQTHRIARTYMYTLSLLSLITHSLSLSLSVSVSLCPVCENSFFTNYNAFNFCTYQSMHFVSLYWLWHLVVFETYELYHSQRLLKISLSLSSFNLGPIKPQFLQQDLNNPLQFTLDAHPLWGFVFFMINLVCPSLKI